jgi:hypothetical protein
MNSAAIKFLTRIVPFICLAMFGLAEARAGMQHDAACLGLEFMSLGYDAELTSDLVNLCNDNPDKDLCASTVNRLRVKSKAVPKALDCKGYSNPAAAKRNPAAGE